jgi:hypothetical protein
MMSIVMVLRDSDKQHYRNFYMPEGKNKEKEETTVINFEKYRYAKNAKTLFPLETAQ